MTVTKANQSIMSFFLFAVVLLASSSTGSAAVDVSSRIMSMVCSNFSTGTAAHPQTAFGFGKVDWGSPEKQAIIDKINECQRNGGIRNGPEALRMLEIGLPDEAVKQVDAMRAAEKAKIAAEDARQAQEKQARIDAEIAKQRSALIAQRAEQQQIEKVRSDLEKLRSLNRAYLDTDAKRAEADQIEEKITSEIKLLKPDNQETFMQTFVVAATRADKPLTDEEKHEQEKVAEAKRAQEEARRQLEEQERRQRVAVQQEKDRAEKQAQKDEQQGVMIGEQLYIEKHCSNLSPDEDMIDSITQNSDQPEIKSPSKLSAKERSLGQKTLQDLETQAGQQSGIKAGSPMDVQVKCGLLANAFADTLHIYRYSN